MIDWIKNVRENYRKTMHTSSENCYYCNNYSYTPKCGGVVRIEYCRKHHKHGVEACPDWQQFCPSDWPDFIFEKGRVER